MELTLFEAFRDAQDQSGVFILYIPSDAKPSGDHLDRILSLLSIFNFPSSFIVLPDHNDSFNAELQLWLHQYIQIADRGGIKKSYEEFVHSLPANQFIKFKARIEVEHPHISLRSSGGVDIATTRRALKFSEVEAWDTQGKCPTLCDLTHKFNLPQLSTVTHAQYPSLVIYVEVNVLWW